MCHIESKRLFNKHQPELSTIKILRPFFGATFVSASQDYDRKQQQNWSAHKSKS